MTGHKEPLRWAELTEAASDLSSTQLGTVNARIRAFNDSNNGVAAWGVLLFYLEGGLPLPEGVRTYFCSVATDLVSLRELSGAKKRSARTAVPNLVLRTNKGGGNSIFADYKELIRRYPLARVGRQTRGVHADWPPVSQNSNLSPLRHAYLNSMIAEFNRKNNPLAAWSVFRMYLRHNLPLTAPISSYFGAISEDIVRISMQTTVARRKIPDFVLPGSARGGPSVFSQMATLRLKRRIYISFSRILLRQLNKDPDSSNYITSNIFKNESNDPINYSEYLRRLVLGCERNKGSFQLSRLRQYEGGVIDL